MTRSQSLTADRIFGAAPAFRRWFWLKFVKNNKTRREFMLDEIEVDTDDADGGWTSWLSGGTRSLGSGAILLLSLGFLFWNEGFNKKHSDALAEAGSSVVLASTQLDSSLEGKPVHLTATVTAQGKVLDPLFGVRTSGVAMQRYV
jgi:hypothetical protein